MNIKDLLPAALMPVSEADAVELLKADHQRLSELFDAFDKIKSGRANKEKHRIVKQACDELRVHAQLEEELFYPAVRAAVGDDLMNEAVVEHQTAKDLIAQLDDMTPDDEMYVATFTVLSEYIKHHVNEEENEMFKLARKSEVDMEALGAKMKTRKAALQNRLGKAKKPVRKVARRA